jgi:hypothetical protein
MAEEPVPAEPQTGVTGALTDGTGVSALTPTKLVKDLVADILLGGAAALVGAQILDVGGAIAAPEVAAFAVTGAVIRALYRAALRWATTE